MNAGHQFSQYSAKVIDHFTNPRNMGEMPEPDGIGEVGNPKCGDVMQLSIKIRDGRIADAKFMTFGCCAAIATSSMITEMIKGKRLDELAAITNKTVTDALDGLPKIKLHCSVLAEDALKAALSDYHKRKDGDGHDADKKD